MIVLYIVLASIAYLILGGVVVHLGEKLKLWGYREWFDYSDLGYLSAILWPITVSVYAVIGISLLFWFGFLRFFIKVPEYLIRLPVYVGRVHDKVAKYREKRKEQRKAEAERKAREVKEAKQAAENMNVREVI